MSSLSPLVANWLENNLSWRPVYSPKLVPRTLGNREMYKVGDHKWPEGIILGFYAGFDSPNCGLRIRAGPGLDTERTHTQSHLALALGEVNLYAYALSPPDTPPGMYVAGIMKEWPWLNFIEVYVYNDDTVSHTCLWSRYTLLVLEKSRPTSSREIEEAILATQQKMLGSMGGAK